jgi:hypothetical protein
VENTLDAVEEAFRGAASIEPFLVHPSDDYFLRSINARWYKSYQWDEDTDWFLHFHTYLMQVIYRFESCDYGDKSIVISPLGTQTQFGRARKLNENPVYRKMLPARTPPYFEWISVLLGYDGYYYPSAACDYNPVMRMGHADELSLGDAIDMCQKLKRSAPEHVYPGTSLSIKRCALCRTKKVELFGI